MVCGLWECVKVLQGGAEGCYRAFARGDEHIEGSVIVVNELEYVVRRMLYDRQEQKLRAISLLKVEAGKGKCGV